MDPTRQQKILDLMEAKLAERDGDFVGAKGVGNWEGVSGRGPQENAKIAKIARLLQTFGEGGRQELSYYTGADDDAIAELIVAAMFRDGKIPSMKEIDLTLIGVAPDRQDALGRDREERRMDTWFESRRSGAGPEELDVTEQTSPSDEVSKAATKHALQLFSTKVDQGGTQTADQEEPPLNPLALANAQVTALKNYIDVMPTNSLTGESLVTADTIARIMSTATEGELDRVLRRELQAEDALAGITLQELRGTQERVEAGKQRKFESEEGGKQRTFIAGESELERELRQSEAGLDRGLTVSEGALDRGLVTSEGALDRGLVTSEGALERGLTREQAGLERGLTREQAGLDRGLTVSEAALDRGLTKELSEDQINAAAEQINQQHVNALAQDDARNVFTAQENAADRSLVQQEINNNFAQVNAELARTDAKLAFDNDKFAVETALGRDRQALQTETAIESAMAERRGLTFQYGQLQQDLRQFNVNSRIAVDMENARRKELQQARRAQLAADIGQLAQDAGSRGRLATVLLANPNLGLLSETLAGGQDFFTEESLAPLSDLLRQREDASRDPNLLTYDVVPEIATPDMGAPSFSAPTSYGDLMNMMRDPTEGLGPMTQPSTTSPAPTQSFLQEPVAKGQQVVTAMGDEHARLMAAGVETDSDEYKTAMDAVTPTPEYTARHGGMNVGAQLTELPQSVLDDPRYPGNPNFEMKAGGGLASGAYIGDEKGPELHIPLGPGEALVIPNDKVESFLRSASRAGALGDANAIPEMAGGGKVKSQRQVNFLLSKSSPLTAKERARLKKELKTGDVKIPRMEKGGKFPEDSVAGDLVGMGITAMADGGMFDQGTIFGTAKPADQTQTRNFLQQALRRALTGTPWQGRGRAPTPVEVSAPGTDPMVRELAASLSALGTGTPQDVFLRRAAALTPRGIAERAGGVRRTA
jgi:hypothetical protein